MEYVNANNGNTTAESQYGIAQANIREYVNTCITLKTPEYR